MFIKKFNNHCKNPREEQLHYLPEFYFPIFSRAEERRPTPTDLCFPCAAYSFLSPGVTGLIDLAQLVEPPIFVTQ